MGISYNPTIVTDGLVLCLDAGNTKSYPGTGTTWTAIAGSVNGTLTNGPTYSGSNGGYISLDGTNDSITFGTSILISTTQPFSVNLWLRHNSRTTGSLFHAFTNFATSSGIPFRLALVNGAASGYNGLYMTSNSGWAKASTSYIPTANVWGMYTFTYNGSGATTTSNFKMYWNAEQLNLVSTGGETTPAATVNSNFFGTRNSSSDDQWYKGDIAGYTLYSKMLSADEIKQNYEALRGRFVI